MYKILFCFFICGPMFTDAQSDTGYSGIHFSDGLSWKQVLKKAKKENKFIFLDCFATWCGPCKLMEKNVFSDKQVGDFFNEHFISVRVQMDKTRNDDESVRSWYSTVADINDEYGVPAYPTFLFFSPAGNIINRSQGYIALQDFARLGAEVIRPGILGPYLTYYSKLAKFQNGKKDYSSMPALADTALQLGQKDVAKTIAKEYREYLLELPKDQWMTSGNLRFMASFTQGSSDVFFPIFYKSAKQVDSIVNRTGFSQNVVDKIILKEEVWPISKPIVGLRLTDYKANEEDEEPDWKSLQKLLTAKYSDAFAERNVLFGRIQWYNDHQEWGQVCRYLTIYIRNYLPKCLDDDIATFLNSNCWFAVFKRSVDKDQIDEAIKAMDLLVKQYGYSTLLDTYANLLYKAGRIEEALEAENDAIKKTRSKNYLSALEKMKQRKPTWGHYISKDDFGGFGLID